MRVFVIILMSMIGGIPAYSDESFDSDWTDDDQQITTNIEEFGTFKDARHCVEGPKRHFGCYECTCVGGQVYMCSSEKCPYLSPNASKFGTQKSLTSLLYRERNCVEGRDIKTSTCNRCTCRQGEVYCNTFSCNDYKSNKELFYNLCKEDAKIPSPDNCNKCKCINGEIMCTTKACGPIAMTEYRHCKLQKWHSLKAKSRCKECFCIDGQISFCYLDYCSTRVETLGVGNNIQAIARKYNISLPVKTATCKQSQISKNKCIRCECNAMRKWRCWDKPASSKLNCGGKVQALCESGQYFTMGTADTCQGCYCTNHRRWKCWSLKGACATFNSDECPAGEVVKNTLSHCSMCYCGVDGTNMCTTDENCAHKLQESNKGSENDRCDNIDCLAMCIKEENMNFGICLEGGCECA